MVPRVSVIVPVHNVADSLERCVQSLLDQTVQEFEVVLVDDGSTDESGAICDAFELEDHRVVVIHQENRGVSHARNAGMALARGLFIAFLDADDWTEPEMLGEMADVAEATASDVVLAGCYVDVLSHQGELVSSRSCLPGSAVVGPERPPTELTDDLINLIGYAWNKLYRRELLRRHSTEFTVGLSLGEDLVFNAEVLRNASAVVLLDRPFVHYVQRPRNTLGSAFHPDFLELRLRAVEGIRAVLDRWSVESSAADAVTNNLRVAALRSLARTTSERRDLSIRQRAAHLRDTRRGFDGLVEARQLSASQRLEVWTLRYASTLVIVVGLRARDRWRRLLSWANGGRA